MININILKNKSFLFINTIATVFILFSGCSPKAKNKTIINSKPTVSFGICTDVHYNVIHDAKQRMEIFAMDMEKKKPDFVIELGDFCYPDSTSDDFLNIFNSINCDKHFVLGNHDNDNGVTWAKTMQYFKMPAPYYSFDKNSFHFIVLNGNEICDTCSKGYARYVSEDQKIWLSKDLDKTDKKTIVFIHQGLFDEHGIINKSSIRSILSSKKTIDGENKVLVCFNGHSHIDAAKKIDGIWYVTINSMSYHWVGENFLHKSYNDNVHDKNKWIEYVCPYKKSLYAFVTIDTEGTVTISGTKSEWEGASPKELGYKPEYYLTDWITPKISDRILK